MKKYFLSALVIIGGVVPAAAFGATISVTPSSGAYQVGNIITAQIMVDTQGSAIEGVDVRYLNYNPSLLEVQDENTSIAGVQIAPGTLMPNTVANTVDTALGRIAFSQVINGNATFTGSGVLATVRFRVLAPGSASVVFNFTPGNTADTNIASAGMDVLTSVINAVYALTAIPQQQLAPLIYISPASGNKTTGTSFLLNIMLDTRGTAIDGADIVLTYNRSFVKIADADSITSGVQITPGTLMPNTVANTVNASYGTIDFSQTTAANTSFTGSGVLATVTVQAFAPGAENFTFTFTKGRTTDTNASFGGADLLDAVTNATFTITDNGIPPVVASSEPSGIIMLSSSLTLKVTTNEAATCRYSATPNIAYASMSKYFSSSDGIDHSTSLYAGFQAGQNTFYVRCSDRAGKSMTSDAVISFTIVTDSTAPTVSQLSPSGTFFLPKGLYISTAAQDQSGVLGCKFSPVPNVAYATMTRALYLKGAVFSTFIYGNELHAGQNTFYVRCKDKVGNVNASDAVISFALFTAPTFTVSVEGDSNANAHMFTISLYSPNSTTVTASIKAWADRYGNISFVPDNSRSNMLVSPGNYDVRIASDRYITRKLANTYVGAGAVISVQSLLAGDLNNDTVINSLDWSMINTQWAKTSSSADINRDGKVNTIDWGYVRKNWLQSGS
ncbi:MAG: dockerin type I domain-containing protein [Patescibacteria group bacterium]